MKKLLVSVALLFSMNTVSEAANISYLGKKDNMSVMLLEGAIEVGDLQRVELEYEKARENSNSVFLMLSSLGGNVDEAMRIGDFVEDKNIGTIVPALIGECVSSCVFILAGGDSKTIKGPVGIHRPYISDVSIGGSSGARTLGQYIEKIKTYLDKKGIAPSLAEDMFSVPPEKVKYLTQEELSKYRLDQRNYLKQEANDIEMAKSLGLTRQEYGAKKNQIDRECVDMPHEQEMACFNRIMGTNLK